MNHQPQLKTHFQSIDVATGGFLPGELILIGGRPAMGKTSLALDLLLNHHDGKNLVFLQLENNSNDTFQRIDSKSKHLEYEIKVTVNDLVPNYSEVEVGISDHVIVHLEKPSMLEIFEVLTPILENRDIHGIIIDSLNYIRPHVIALENSKKEKKALRYLKVIAQLFKQPVFVFSGIHRKVEKSRKFEMALGMYGSQTAIVDWSLMLFRWSYYGIEENINGHEVGEEDAKLVIAKSSRLVREYNPRLLFDYSSASFTSQENSWYDYLEENTPPSHDNC